MVTSCDIDVIVVMLCFLLCIRCERGDVMFPSVYNFSSKNWSTPAMVDLKEATVTLIKQTERHFLLAGSAGLQIHTYDVSS